MFTLCMWGALACRYQPHAHSLLLLLEYGKTHGRKTCRLHCPYSVYEDIEMQSRFSFYNSEGYLHVVQHHQLVAVTINQQ